MRISGLMKVIFIVNMDIRSVDDYGKDRLSYFNKDDPSNPNNMWNIEGYSKRK